MRGGIGSSQLYPVTGSSLTLLCEQSYLLDGRTPVSVKLNADGGRRGRVKSHFERLVLPRRGPAVATSSAASRVSSDGDAHAQSPAEVIRQLLTGGPTAGHGAKDACGCGPLMGGQRLISSSEADAQSSAAAGRCPDSRSHGDAQNETGDLSRKRCRGVADSSVDAPHADDPAVECSRRPCMKEQWASMFNIRCAEDRRRKPRSELLEDVAALVAEELLRQRPLIPPHPTDATASLSPSDLRGELPIVFCSCLRCTWTLFQVEMPIDAGDENPPELEKAFRMEVDHPCDVQLRKHVLEMHGKEIRTLALSLMPECDVSGHVWDLYKEALSVRERAAVPYAGVWNDRRCFQYTSYVFNDQRIRSLMCFGCAQIKLDSGGIRSEIEFRSGSWLFTCPPGMLYKCFGMSLYEERYRQPGTALALVGNQSTSDVPGLDLTHWQLEIHPDWLSRMCQCSAQAQEAMKEDCVASVEDMTCAALLCCPEDQKCE